MECPYKKNVTILVISKNTPHEDNENFIAQENWIKSQIVSFGECTKEECAVWIDNKCHYKA